MTLYDFATKLYAEPGVAPACLALQDRYAVNVNELLFAAWVGFECGVRMAPQDFTDAAQHVRAWREQVVEPLREVRRRMKDGVLASFHLGSSQMREQVKALELRAEQLQLEALEAWAASKIQKDIAKTSVLSGSKNMHDLLRMQTHLREVDLESAGLAALHQGLLYLAQRRG